MSSFDYDRTEKCPYCGSSNIGEGIQNGYGAVTVKGKFFSTDALVMRICTDCGTVVRSFVRHPERFKPKEK